MKVYIKKSVSANYELIETPDKELGKGGQARVYKISTRGYEDYCLKKFIRIDDAKRNYERIAYMIQHPPKNIMGSPNFRICWPTAFAYDESKNFIGYVMPLAFPNSRDLKILEVYNAKPISQQAKYKKYPDWFNKFELDTNEGLKNRMKMLCNWAVAIHMLHETHKYVIVDLKPENVMATSSGKISVVDTDSFQISENNNILYPGAAFTPPYFPPEGKSLQKKGEPFTESCDRFAAAICFYKILVGLHPYGGTIKKSPYDKLTTEEEFIEAGLYAYGEKKRYFSFPSGFNLHQNYNNLSPALQSLFARAFGSDYGNRPSMEEWGKALRESATSSSNIVRSVVKPTKINTLAVKITDVTFANADYDGNIINDYGSTLRTDVEYLTPKLTYQVLHKGSPVTIGCKIFSPNGQVLTDGDAKSGYYYTAQLPCDTQSTCTYRMVGLGNANKTLYKEAGTYRVEFYQDDKCLYKTSFEIHPKIYSTVSSPSRSASSSSSSSSSSSLSTYIPSTYKPSLNDRVAWVGDWFSEHSDDAASIVGIVAAVIVGLAVLGGAIAVFVEAGIIWGILGLGLFATIGYYGCMIALSAGAVISKILFGFLRVIFYNLYVLLLFILIPTGIFIYKAVEDRAYTQPTVQTTQVKIATTTYYCTASSGVNVRSTPSTSSSIVGKLKHGQAVEVYQLGESFSKIKFKHAKGETAWVSSKYLSTTKPATKIETKKTTSNNSSKTTSTTTSKANTSSSTSKTTTNASSSKSSTSTSETKLLVDSKVSVYYKISSKAGQRIFAISTSASDYQIVSKPSWCTIIAKNKGTFEIKYEANPLNAERSGKIQVKAGDATASIALVQSAGVGNQSSNSTSATRVSSYSPSSTSSNNSSSTTTPSKGMHNGHEYVDLGLSVKWATNNMYGHYRFGEKNPRPTRVGNTDSYRGSTYSLSNDVARANWGGNWRLPTKSEFEELINKCKWTATTQGGVRGLKVTGPTGNSIFLPAAGYRHESTNDLMSRNEVGYYWSSTSYGGGRVWTLNIWCGGSSSQKMAGAYGSFGNCIRPVCR